MANGKNAPYATVMVFFLIHPASHRDNYGAAQMRGRGHVRDVLGREQFYHQMLNHNAQIAGKLMGGWGYTFAIGHRFRGTELLCADCNKDFPMSQLRFKPDGVVPNSHGMKAHRAQCNDCSRKIAIDDTTMKTREPGEDG